MLFSKQAFDFLTIQLFLFERPEGKFQHNSLLGRKEVKFRSVRRKEDHSGGGGCSGNQNVSSTPTLRPNNSDNRQIIQITVPVILFFV